MDIFLIGSAVVLFLFGALLLFKPVVVVKISDWLNKSILPIEDKMRSSHSVSGILLVILSVIVLYLAMKK